MAFCVACGQQVYPLGPDNIFKGRIYCQRHNPEQIDPAVKKSVEEKLRHIRAEAESQAAKAKVPVPRVIRASSGTLSEFLGGQESA